MFNKPHTIESRKKISESVRLAKPAKPLEKRNCEWCGQEYTIPSKAGERDRSKRRYCTRSCGAKANPPKGWNGTAKAHIRGEGNHNWKGGRIIDALGYVRIRVDNKYVKEHRFVMEQTLGRPLVGKENVHHINGVKTDNSPENLELWTSHQPKGQRGHCPTCTCDKINV